MGAHRIRNRHFDLIVHSRWTEVSDVQVDPCPRRVRAFDDFNRVFREVRDAAIVLHTQDQAAGAGILGATFQRVGCKSDGLFESGPVRLRSAEHAHMRRAEFLRDVQPFAQLVELLFPQCSRGLGNVHAAKETSIP